MKKLLFFLPDLFLYVLKSLSVRLYYHLHSLCICIYIFLFSSFFFSIFPPSSFSKNSVDSVAFSTQRRKLFFATRCSTWPCCEMRKTRPFIINLPATKADVSPTTPFFSLPPFFLFSLFLSLFLSSLPFFLFLSLLSSFFHRVFLLFPDPTCLMEFRRMPHALPLVLLSCTFCWHSLARWNTDCSSFWILSSSRGRILTTENT